MIRFRCKACTKIADVDNVPAGAVLACPHCGEFCVVPPATGAEFPPDIDPASLATFRYVQAFTMTGIELVFALCKAVEYIVAHQIPGDIVECGVWRGGSMMAVARTLQAQRAVRRLHLFDTFEGMPPPAEIDKDLRGEPASVQLQNADKHTSMLWAISPLDEVKRNLASTGYDPGQMTFIQGRVEETIPAQAPQQISLLRLDTDWYASTYHELVHLYPRLSPGGVLIIDDYGHWQGARRAVDQYLAENRVKILLNRIDYSGRIAAKSAI